MRHGSSNRRQRNRGGSSSSGGNNNGRRSNAHQKTQVFDSNGPDVRIRGTAYQVAEKYVALAKDAHGAGDTVLYQSYLQHAEHYQRMINTWEAESQTFEITDVEFEDKKSKHVQRNVGAGDTAGDDDLSLPSSLFGESSKVSSSNDSEMEIS